RAARRGDDLGGRRVRHGRVAADAPGAPDRPRAGAARPARRGALMLGVPNQTVLAPARSSGLGAARPAAIPATIAVGAAPPAPGSIEGEPGLFSWSTAALVGVALVSGTLLVLMKPKAWIAPTAREQLDRWRGAVPTPAPDPEAP